ncbi:FKBP-type peptidyl-prolyl cis-trans isomerase [Pedobacter sp. UC225_61]|uniref:FKBP-type peptidyl-prolyl cis-trans isomerase n=1 Tax=Pedobacter sp. UC225_61 TaxID=3374623 RepID=UPI0037B09CA8
MNRLILVLTAAICITAVSLHAQTNRVILGNGVPNVKNLNVGDQVPDFQVGRIFNSPAKTARIADFKKQLLIVDFWSTWCKGCVEALPEMDALQKKFGNRIKVLPVTYQSEDIVTKFWRSNHYTKSLSLSSVVDDKLFSQYFTHRSIPHEVWIYKGKVIAITQPEYVDANNIEKVLNGEPINWPVKDDFYVFDPTRERLFHPDADQIDTSTTFLKYAAISGYKEGVNNELNGIVRDPLKKTIRAYGLNNSIYNTYLLNWNKVANLGSLVKPDIAIGPNQVIWEVTERSRYEFSSGLGYREDWLRKNGICFESVNTDTGQNDIGVAKSIISDLDALLGLKVRWEKRKEKVLILVLTGGMDRLRSRKAIGFNDKTREWMEKKYIQKGHLHQFRDFRIPIAEAMNKEEINPYVFDETGYKGMVDMDLNIPSWTDIAAVRKAIAPYGLELREEEREVDKFVFTEVDGGLLVDGEGQAAARAKRTVQIGMKNPSPEENAAFLKANKKKPGVVSLPSGLQYKILKKGTGAKPGIDDRVRVHFTGTLVNGKIFESSLEIGRPLTTAIGAVIRGWQEALPLMPVGSKWILYVPSELAYGSHTNQGTIPPNSVLIFEIELLQIVK